MRKEVCYCFWFHGAQFSSIFMSQLYSYTLFSYPYPSSQICGTIILKIHLTTQEFWMYIFLELRTCKVYFTLSKIILIFWINFSLNLNCSQTYAFSLIDYLFPMSNLFLIKVALMSKFLSEISEMSFFKEWNVYHQSIAKCTQVAYTIQVNIYWLLLQYLSLLFWIVHISFKTLSFVQQKCIGIDSSKKRFYQKSLGKSLNY